MRRLKVGRLKVRGEKVGRLRDEEEH